MASSPAQAEHQAILDVRPARGTGFRGSWSTETTSLRCTSCGSRRIARAREARARPSIDVQDDAVPAGTFEGDPRGYRPKGETEEVKTKEPDSEVRARLLEMGVALQGAGWATIDGFRSGRVWTRRPLCRREPRPLTPVSSTRTCHRVTAPGPCRRVARAKEDHPMPTDDILPRRSRTASDWRCADPTGVRVGRGRHPRRPLCSWRARQRFGKKRVRDTPITEERDHRSAVAPQRAG